MIRCPIWSESEGRGILVARLLSCLRLCQVKRYVYIKAVLKSFNLAEDSLTSSLHRRYHKSCCSDSTPYRHYPSRQAMTLIGLTPHFQDAVTDRRFSHSFETETTKIWINDTLRMNYLTLLQLLSRLKNHANRSMVKKSKRGPWSLNDNGRELNNEELTRRTIEEARDSGSISSQGTEYYCV